MTQHEKPRPLCIIADMLKTPLLICMIFGTFQKCFVNTSVILFRVFLQNEVALPGIMLLLLS